MFEVLFVVVAPLWITLPFCLYGGSAPHSTGILVFVFHMLYFNYYLFNYYMVLYRFVYLIMVIE